MSIFKFAQVLENLSQVQINQSLIKSYKENQQQQHNQQQRHLSESASFQLDQEQKAGPKQSDRTNEFPDNAHSSNKKQVEEEKTDQYMKENEQMIELIDSDNEDQHLETLSDFVDEDSVKEISLKAKQSLLSLKILKEKAIEGAESLIKKTEQQISSIYQSKGNLDFQFQSLHDNWQKIRSYFLEIDKVKKNFEQLHIFIKQSGMGMSSTQAASQLSQEQLNHLQEQLVLSKVRSQGLSEELKTLVDVFKTGSDTYDEFYEESREAYVNFVNFAPSVKQHMIEVDKYLQQYEIQRVQTLEDLEEIEKLSTWYEYFLKSYSEFEIELERRKKQKQLMSERIKLMQQFLDQELENETRHRIDFNEKNYRYLPQNLKQLLEEPPTRYTIYPKDFELQQIRDGRERTNDQNIMNLQIFDNSKLIDFLQQVSPSFSNPVVGTSQSQENTLNQNVQDLQKQKDQQQQQECDYNLIQYEDYEPIHIEKKSSPNKTVQTNTSTKASDEEPKLSSSEQQQQQKV